MWSTQYLPLYYLSIKISWITHKLSEQTQVSALGKILSGFTNARIPKCPETKRAIPRRSKQPLVPQNHRDLRVQTPPYEGPTPAYEGPGASGQLTILHGDLLILHVPTHSHNSTLSCKWFISPAPMWWFQRGTMHHTPEKKARTDGSRRGAVTSLTSVRHTWHIQCR